MAPVPLSMIIVNWNSKEYVRQCISSVVANTADIEFEIIVVDSGSFDGCGDMLRETFPQVRFVQSNVNVGFARANNLGVQYARGDVLLLLNPDTEVRGNAIGEMYTYIKQLPRPGVIGCRLLNSDGSIQSSCVQPFPTISNQILNSRLLQQWFPQVELWPSALSFKHVKVPVAVEAVSGACMLIQREVFDLVAGFSTDYFMYGEDLDLCYKTRVAGFINYHLPAIEIVHHGGGSTRHTRFCDIMVRESVRRLLAKTHGDQYSFGYRLSLTASAVVRLAVLLLVLPAAVTGRRMTRWRGSFGRWSSVLRWGVGLENWVAKYGGPAQAEDGVAP